MTEQKAKVRLVDELEGTNLSGEDILTIVAALVFASKRREDFKTECGTIANDCLDSLTAV